LTALTDGQVEPGCVGTDHSLPSTPHAYLRRGLRPAEGGAALSHSCDRIAKTTTDFVYLCVTGGRLPRKSATDPTTVTDPRL
jgi:hypothetical protein